MQLEKEQAAERALIEAHELQEHEERRVEAETKKKEAKEIEEQENKQKEEAIKKRREEEKATKKNKETKDQQQMKVAEQEKPLEQASEIASKIFSDTTTIVHISPIGLSTQMHQEKGKIYLFSISSYYF